MCVCVVLYILYTYVVSILERILSQLINLQFNDEFLPLIKHMQTRQL